jgi:hypothetical protein
MKLKNILRKRLKLGENRRIEKPMTKKKEQTWRTHLNKKNILHQNNTILF